MGALLNGKCFSTSSEAVDAYFSSAPPSYTAGGTSYLAEYVKSGAIWQIRRYQIASNGTTTTLNTVTAPLPTFPLCDPTESFFDGVDVGWGVAAAIIVAASIRLMRRAVG